MSSLHHKLINYLCIYGSDKLFLPERNDDCFKTLTDPNGTEYRGYKTATRTGLSCQNWSLQNTLDFK